MPETPEFYYDNSYQTVAGIIMATATSGASTNGQQDTSTLNHFLKQLPFPERTIAYIVGDHGRQEELPKISSWHVVIVSEKELSEALQKRTNELVKARLGSTIEWKTTDSEPLFKCNLTDASIPSRFLHMIPLCGSKSCFETSFYQFIKEIKEMPCEDRQNFRKEFVKNHLKQLSMTLNGDDTSGVDLETGKIIYGGAASHATKHSLLYPIQYTLDLRIIDSIRVLGQWPRDILTHLLYMPRKIPEAIAYMHNEGLLPELNKQDVMDLQEAYRVGLFHLKEAQKKFQGSETPIHYIVSDLAKLKEAYSTAQRVLGKIDSKEYCKQRSFLI